MSTHLVYQWTVFVFATLLLWAAAADYRFNIIPNRICLALIAFYPIHAASAPASMNWRGAAIVAALTFAVGALLFARRILGGGDVKLLTAVALWAGPQFFMPTLLSIGVAGGALAVAAMRLPMLALAKPMAVGLVGDGDRNGTKIATGENARVRLSVPYGVAIAAGSFFLVAQLLTAQGRF